MSRIQEAVFSLEGDSVVTFHGTSETVVEPPNLAAVHGTGNSRLQSFGLGLESLVPVSVSSLDGLKENVSNLHKSRIKVLTLFSYF